MKTIIVGAAISIFTAIGFVISVIINVLTLGQFKILSNVMGVVMLSAFPVSLLISLIQKLRSK